MNLKKIALASVLASGALLGAGSVNAACTVYGAVEQVYADNTWTYVYLSPSNQYAVPSYVYYFGTPDPDLAKTLSNSLHKNIIISGNAASCPAAGSYRYGGTASYAYVN